MPNFAYTRNIPNGPNDPADDQPNMQTNTNSTDDLIAYNHYSFGNNDGGKHKYCQMARQTLNPTIESNDGVTFVKQVGSNNELFYEYGSAPQNTFQITNDGALAADNGRTSLIGPEANPLKMVWGVKAAPGTSGSENFVQAFVNSCFVVTLQALDTNPNANPICVVRSKSTTGFTYTVTAATATTTLFYTAIGN